MGVGEDPVGEDGMDIDAPALPPAGVEAADEGVIRKGDPGDFYMKVIAKKFRGVWHYGVITGVVTECVLEDYGGATQWRAIFEDGDTVDFLRSEVVEAMAAAQEHPPVDADGEARLVTVPEGDDLFAQQINRMKAHRLYREPNPNKKGYMASEDAGPGAVETPIRLVGSASAAWEDAVDFKDHLEKLLDDVRRTVQCSHSYAPILAGWGAVLPGWTPSGGAWGLLAYKAASLRNGDKPRLHRGGGGGGEDGETSRDNSFVYKMLKQVPDADPPPYTTEELESDEELPRNLLAEREDAKYTTMVARAQHFYLATPPPPPGADSDDSRASARPIRAALCTVWTPERAHTAVGLDVWRVPGGGGGSGGEEALVLLDDKLNRLSRQATRLIGRATRNARWLPVRELQSLAGQAQYLFLAIPAARFFLWELHSVVGDRLEARVFWSSADERQHITCKELKAVRLAVESFLPNLAGRNALLHEDNQAGCHVLAGLTSRSPKMMAELRRLCDDWQLDPLMFGELGSRFGPHSIDRFASALNTLLPRYNAAWLDPTCEAVDSLHLPDANWRRENNWCNAPWPMLPDLVQKL
eukprot:jgi/Tetstr1/448380/TSEL_035661.t1